MLKKIRIPYIPLQNANNIYFKDYFIILAEKKLLTNNMKRLFSNKKYGSIFPISMEKLKLKKQMLINMQLIITLNYTCKLLAIDLFYLNISVIFTIKL